ncbi:tetratricopeptide repeat protein [Erythrobacter sp. YJ-T3-07]|uniref:tetratricopeptide repeat protein n=1 Tax=Erythrobacter sp. YJ-T3-07 TaxID=2793063 RepID=UPI0018D31AD7|nr:tetratricopeptide repeat protein [Erythrobacter sp. YJ-T3-07]MBH1944879.1 tetratricopeptide repeat protein [Erythrobacter sp. YJ-T3-07]
MDIEGSESGRWRFGRILFDEASGTLAIEGQAVEIDRTCVALLGALLRQVDQPIGKDELLEIGWPGRIVHENSLAKAISRLRQALGEDGTRIEAVYGSGYRLVGPVRRLSGKTFGRSGEAHLLARLGARLFGDPRRATVSGALALAAIGLALAGTAGWWALSMNAQVKEQEREVEGLLAFLSSDLLAGADPYSPRYQDQSLRQVVERTAATIDDRLRDDPATRAMLHRTVAQAFSGWGEYEKAVSHFDRAQVLNSSLHGALARQNIPVDIGLCQNLRLAGETRRAERICLRAEEVAIRERSPLLGAAQIVRAKLYFEIGDYDRAVTSLAKVLQDAKGLSSAERADAEWFHALSLRKLGRFDLADAAFRRHLTIREKTLGASHPLTGWAHADYGDFLVSMGEYARAERHLGAAQKIFDAALGPDHPEAQSPAYSRAIAASSRGDGAAALAILRPQLARYRETLGSDHFWTLYVMSELALAEAQAGDPARAEGLLREARQTGARVLYGREGKAVHFHMRWARALAALGKADEAEDERRRAREAMDHAGFIPDHPWRARLHCLSGQIALARGDSGAARQAGRACLSALGAVDGLPQTYPALAEAKELAGLNIRTAR